MQLNDVVTSYLNNYAIYVFRLNPDTILKNIRNQKDFQIFLLTELMLSKNVSKTAAFEFISLALNDDTISSELKTSVSLYYHLVSQYQ